MKHECINHIRKRMYRGLEKVVKDAKSAVGCGLGGKGKLTQVRMKKWSQYYRNAVVKHSPNVAKTSDAIWAIYQHSVSTEDDPQHDNCDVDWYWWQQAMAAGVDPEERRQEGRHDAPLPLPLLSVCCPSSSVSANQIFWNAACRSAHRMQTNHSTVLSGGGRQRPSSLPGALWRLRLHSVWYSSTVGGGILLGASNAVIALPDSSSNQLAVVAANMDRRRLKHGCHTAKEESKTIQST